MRVSRWLRLIPMSGLNSRCGSLVPSRAYSNMVHATSPRRWCMVCLRGDSLEGERSRASGLTVSPELTSNLPQTPDGFTCEVDFPVSM